MRMLCFTILVIAGGGFFAWVTSDGIQSVANQQSALGWGATGAAVGMIVAAIGLWLTKESKT